MKLLMILMSFLMVSCSSLKTNEINYSTDSTKMNGYLAKSSKIKGKRPGLIIVHEWWGHNDYVRHRADMLADLGYVAFALDMYGEGKQANHPKLAGEFATAVMTNQKEAAARFQKALEVLKNDPDVDQTKIAAIGYCFGGGVVLAMATGGMDLNGVVSFHGSLGHIKKVSKKAKAKYLVLNGEADPMVTAKDIKNFKKVMKKSKADYKFVNYPGALHAFSNPAATEIGKKFSLPVAYNAEADKASWEEMKMFFDKIFN